MESFALQCSQDSKARPVGAPCGPQIFQPDVRTSVSPERVFPISQSPLLRTDVHRAGRSCPHPLSFKSALTCPSRPLLSVSSPS